MQTRIRCSRCQITFRTARPFPSHRHGRNRADGPGRLWPRHNMSSLDRRPAQRQAARVVLGAAEAARCTGGVSSEGSPNARRTT